MRASRGILADLDSTSDSVSPAAGKPRRRTVLASALLCGVLGLVVLYTSRRAFFSPLAIVVVAAIGLVAVMLQLRFHNRGGGEAVHAPVWLNVLGVIFAVAALSADYIGMGSNLAQLMALGAVGSFGISGAMILHAFRKHRTTSK